MHNNYVKNEAQKDHLQKIFRAVLNATLIVLWIVIGLAEERRRASLVTLCLYAVQQGYTFGCVSWL